RCERGLHGGAVLGGRWRRRIALAVVDAETATDVDVAELDAVLAELLDERDEPRDRVGERRRLRQLAADVEVDADHVEARALRGIAEQARRLGHRHAELVLLEA